MVEPINNIKNADLSFDKRTIIKKNKISNSLYLFKFFKLKKIKARKVILLMNAPTIYSSPKGPLNLFNLTNPSLFKII